MGLQTRGGQPREVPLGEHHRFKKCVCIQGETEHFHGKEIQYKSLSTQTAHLAQKTLSCTGPEARAKYHTHFCKQILRAVARDRKPH